MKKNELIDKEIKKINGVYLGTPIDTIEKRCCKIRGVIHIGGSKGEEFTEYDNAGIKNIEWFEADPLNYEIMKERQRRGGLGESGVHCYAVGNKNQVVFFYRTNLMSAGASLLPLGSIESCTNLKQESRIMVDSITLDEFFETHDVANYNMLNIDVQGGEMLVFEGAEKVLKNFDIVLVELNDEGSYEGCADRWEVINYLDKKGLALLDIKKINGCQYEALFIRS